jgi:hypothetical protein
LLGPGRCATRWVPVVDSGWVPTLTPNGAPNAWFYSRGC